MKFCLSNRQTPAYLRKADEIWVKYNDRKAIPDYAEKYEGKSIVLEIPPQTDYDIKEIKEYFILSREKFSVCVPDIRREYIQQLKVENIPFFWGYAVATPYELEGLVAAGVCQARVAAPLFFQQDIIKKFNIPLRATVNVAHEGYFERRDGVNGTWIRPEDLYLYKETVEVVDFADCDINKEQALFRIYAEQHKWPGQLDLLISNLGASPTNRMLPPELGKARLNCGQRCAAKGACRICYRYFTLADPALIKGYLEATSQD